MKRKILKIVALIIAIAMIVGICLVANAFCGNPVSKMLARRAAERWLKGSFPNSDYYIEDVAFNFKDTNYYAHICSESSMDTKFTLYINMFGQGYYDTYESVTNGFVTAQRVEQEYRELVDQVLNSPAFPYPSVIQFGTLEIFPQEAFDDPLVTDVPDYALNQNELVMDQVYDPRDLGARAGHLVIYVDNEVISFDVAAQILLEIRSQFDKANIPFRAIDFVLEYPLSEEGPRPDSDIRVEDFLYEDIYEADLADRIAEADAALKAYYAELDDKIK